MTITRNNYEAYFLDYLESNLSPHLLPELHRFLNENPDLKAELEMVADFQLSAPILTFNKKTMLYKGSEFLYWNLLPGYGLRKYEKPNAAVWKGLASAGVLPKLTAPHIVFENKAALKQAVAGAKVVQLRRAFYYSAAAAAIAALIWTNLSNENTFPANGAYSYDGTSSKVPVNQTTKEISSPADDQLIHTADNKIDGKQKKKNSIPYVAPSAPVNNDALANTPQNEENSQPIVPNVTEEEQSFALENQHPETTPTPSNPSVEQWPEVIDVAYTNATTTRKAYSSIWELAEDKAKAKLWGNQNYPTEKFGTSLASRELSQYTKPSPEKKIVVEKVENENGRFIRIKLGKFEHTRRI